jgi:hypothetical protein
MKSFLCQGKTISDAIQRAMKESGNPEIFNIKIVDRGSQSIFWWLSKEAIIIFSYDDVSSRQQNGPVKSYKKNLYHHKNHSFHDEPSVTSNLKNQKKVLDIKDKKNDISKSNDFNYDNSNDSHIQNSHSSSQSYGMNRGASRGVRKNPKSDVQRLDIQSGSKEKRNSQQPQSHTNSFKNEGAENDFRKPIKKFESQSIVSDNKNEKSKKVLPLKEDTANQKVVQSVQPLNNLLWTEDRIAFVKNWIDKLNEYMHFASEGVDYKVENNKLIIKINRLDGDIERDKKYFYSSIVLLLYQSFQNKFLINDMQENDFKIVIE